MHATHLGDEAVSLGSSPVEDGAFIARGDEVAWRRRKCDARRRSRQSADPRGTGTWRRRKLTRMSRTAHAAPHHASADPPGSTQRCHTNLAHLYCEMRRSDGHPHNEARPHPTRVFEGSAGNDAMARTGLCWKNFGLTLRRPNFSVDLARWLVATSLPRSITQPCGDLSKSRDCMPVLKPGRDAGLGTYGRVSDTATRPSARVRL